MAKASPTHASVLQFAVVLGIRSIFSDWDTTEIVLNSLAVAVRSRRIAISNLLASQSNDQV